MRPRCVRQHRYFRLSLASPLGLSLGEVALSAVPLTAQQVRLLPNIALTGVSTI